MQPFGVVILAGGSGVRFGAPKAFVEFDGDPLWTYPYSVCQSIPECERIVVVFPKGSKHHYVNFIEGGCGRARDCLEALEYIESRRVVVLEAARPLVTRGQILRLAGGLYPNIIYGYRDVNTFYFDDADYLCQQQFFCASMEGWELLGTGGYDTEKLREAYYLVDEDITCDSWAIKEAHDIDPVVWSVGSLNNLFKVTYPHHLKVLGVIKENMEGK